MPTVPRLDSPSVRTAALNPATVRPADSSGLVDLGQGIQRAAGAAFGIAQDARRKAVAMQVTDFDTKFEQRWTEKFHDDQSGLRAKRGQAAFADGADTKTLADMDKYRQELLAAIPDADAREIAAQRAQQKMAGFNREVEGYVGGQRKAAEAASLQANVATTMDAVALDYANPTRRAELIEALRVPMMELSLSPEAGAAAFAETVKKADGIVLNRYLGEKDIEGAKVYFAQAKDRLGTDAQRYERSLYKADLARKADGLAAGIISKARDPNTGLFSEAAARTAIDALTDLDGETRAAVTDAMQPMLTNANALVDAQKADVRNLARGLYNRGGLNAVRAHAMPDGSNLLDYLNTNDAEYEALLGNDARRRAKEGRETRTQQNGRDAQALAEFRALDPEDRLKANVDDFGMQWGASALGTSKLREEQQKSKGMVEKGHAAGERSFVRDAEIQATGLPDFTATQGGSQGKQIEARKKGLRAGAAVSYSQFVEKNKREPDDKERQDMLDTLITKRVTEEHWYGDDKEFGFESELREAREGAAPAAPAAKTITKYLRSPDGSRRVPVYADGSVGPEEMVR